MVFQKPLTKFLSIEEQKYLQNQKHVHVYFSNIYPQEERRRAFLTKETISRNRF